MLIDEAKQKLNEGVDKFTAAKRVAEQIMGILHPECKKVVDDATKEFRETINGIFQNLAEDQHQALIDYASDKFLLYGFYVKLEHDEIENYQQMRLR